MKKNYLKLIYFFLMINICQIILCQSYFSQRKDYKESNFGVGIGVEFSDGVMQNEYFFFKRDYPTTGITTEPLVLRKFLASNPVNFYETPTLWPMDNILVEMYTTVGRLNLFVDIGFSYESSSKRFPWTYTWYRDNITYSAEDVVYLRNFVFSLENRTQLMSASDNFIPFLNFGFSLAFYSATLKYQYFVETESISISPGEPVSYYLDKYTKSVTTNKLKGDVFVALSVAINVIKNFVFEPAVKIYLSNFVSVYRFIVAMRI
ncbi:MAG: hypothetical protein NZ839_04835 [Endomicrobia bacterium]|nr:hypothetical protein [Endomicrobiia bacterium]